jgi:diguanylate cyclase (GGDEF)-like protein/PAS domain S-box-containing protein
MAGQERVIAWSNTLLKDEAGQVIGVLSSGEDMTERILAARQIEERQRYLEGVLRAAPDAIVTLDAQHRVVEWNPGAEQLFGYTDKEVMGQELDSLVTNSDLMEEAVGFTRSVMDGGDIPPTETVRYRKDGKPVDVILAGSPIRVRDQLVGAVAVYIDISQRKRMEQQLAHSATHDALTDLPNRMLFNDRLNMAIEQADINQSKVAIMMLDLDRFKEVNDTLGHDVGDILLQAVGSRLKNTLRNSDTVARMGGDEFMLILPNVMLAKNADSIAEKILVGFQKTFKIEDHWLDVTISIGIAIYPDDGEDGETLIKNADIAMYQSKQGGRNQYHRFTSRDPG